MNHILAIDQGTTSSRVIVYDEAARPVFTAQEEFTQHYPADGHVEHCAEEIWQSVLKCLKKALARYKNIAAIGITNQRETTLIWDRQTGQPIHNAIVWQDRRTAGFCDRLRQDELEEMINDKTGLLPDPYFSASKIKWILDNVAGARARANKGELCFGTMDTWLIWKLTGGRVHATDATNASRTMIYNIKTGQWDEELSSLFDIPASLLPKVKNCADDFGVSDKSITGAAIPINGVAGDQQAAAIGQNCFNAGDIKSTYGTGCFVLLNTGSKKIKSENRLLATIAWQLDGKMCYALEGSIFIAGAAVQWLRDGLGIIKSAPEINALAQSIDDNQGVYFVPALTGLGAPHWRADAKGMIYGIGRDTGRAHFARAALEAVCYQTYDLLAAMQADGADVKSLKIDGGMAASDFTMQFLADILDMQITRPKNIETTALGAALLAGHYCGIYGDVRKFTLKADKIFSPKMNKKTRDKNLTGWQKAIARVLG